MPIERFRPSRSEGDADGVAQFAQLQRWLDDGGAQAADPRLGRPATSAPVTWSPVALSARLEAERALRALPRRPWGISADGRKAIGRIVAEVEHRQLSLDAATTRLRDLTLRLHQHRLAEESRDHPQEWQLLRATLRANRSPAPRRVQHATADGDSTYGRG
jgi:hypothetical protein